MIYLYLLDEKINNGSNHIFLNFAFVASIFCGIFVIISKNPIVSVLFLIGLFLNVAAYLMLLGMNFIGLSYLLVYVGAVSILFLFILMLINVRISELVTDTSNSIPLAIAVGIIFNMVVYEVLPSSNMKFTNYIYDINKTFVSLLDHHSDSFSAAEIQKMITKTPNEDIVFVASQTWEGSLAETSHITTLGNIIYTTYPIWLIITSIILLLAMVGAIVITIKSNDNQLTIQEKLSDVTDKKVTKHDGGKEHSEIDIKPSSTNKGKPGNSISPGVHYTTRRTFSSSCRRLADNGNQFGTNNNSQPNARVIPNTSNNEAQGTEPNVANVPNDNVATNQPMSPEATPEPSTGPTSPDSEIGSLPSKDSDSSEIRKVNREARDESASNKRIFDDNVSDIKRGKMAITGDYEIHANNVARALESSGLLTGGELNELTRARKAYIMGREPRNITNNLDSARAEERANTDTKWYFDNVTKLGDKYPLALTTSRKESLGIIKSQALGTLDQQEDNIDKLYDTAETRENIIDKKQEIQKKRDQAHGGSEENTQELTSTDQITSSSSVNTQVGSSNTRTTSVESSITSTEGTQTKESSNSDLEGSKQKNSPSASAIDPGEGSSKKRGRDHTQPDPEEGSSNRKKGKNKEEDPQEGSSKSTDQKSNESNADQSNTPQIETSEVQSNPSVQENSGSGSPRSFPQDSSHVVADYTVMPGIFDYGDDS